MKTHTLLTGALTAVMAFTGLAQAQSSARQERFEAFVQAQLLSGQLPLTALTRRQQANFGIAPLVLAEEQLFELGTIVSAEFPEQGFSFLNSDGVGTLLGEGNGNLAHQRLNFERDEPRRNSRELTTIREIRRSGLILTGTLEERFARPEFAASSLRDRVRLSNPLEFNFLFLGLTVTTAQANAQGADQGNAAFDFFGGVDGGTFPEDFSRRDFVRLYQANARRTARAVRELLAINPNFNPIF